MTLKSAVLLCSAFGISVAGAKDKPDPRLSSVSTIFVLGNSPAAERIRSVIRDGKKTCFSLATKPADGDAVLDTSDNSQMEPGSLVGEWLDRFRQSHSEV